MTMGTEARENLNNRIKGYFIEEIRKCCGKDFPLIEDHIEVLCSYDDLRKSKLNALAAIAAIKNRQRPAE